MISKVMRTIIFNIVTLVLTLTACQQSMSYKELNDYLGNPKNKLIQSASSERINYTLQYVPKAVLFKNVIDKESYQNNNMLYFQLSMSTLSNQEIVKLAQSEEEYTTLLHTLHTGLGSKIELLGTHDTLNVLSHIYTRTYGYATTTQVLLVFDEDKVLENKYFKVRLSDLAPIDYTRIQFEFNTRDIKRSQKKLDTKHLNDE